MSRQRHRTSTAALIAAVALLVGAAPAGATTAQEESQGAALLTAVDSGKRTCDSLEDADFERIGDYVMGRMLGSTDAHASMDELMDSMMGEEATTTAHVVMGRRFARCGGDASDPAFDGMMGMMGGGFGAGAMMGGNSVRGMMGGGSYGPGLMMGRGYADDDDWDGGAWMAIMMGVLLLVVIGVLAAWKPWRSSVTESPMDILRARLARGEIDQDEFERRRDALGGTA